MIRCHVLEAPMRKAEIRTKMGASWTVWACVPYRMEPTVKIGKLKDGGPTYQLRQWRNSAPKSHPMRMWLVSFFNLLPRSRASHHYLEADMHNISPKMGQISRELFRSGLRISLAPKLLCAAQLEPASLSTSLDPAILPSDTRLQLRR